MDFFPIIGNEVVYTDSWGRIIGTATNTLGYEVVDVSVRLPDDTALNEAIGRKDFRSVEIKNYKYSCIKVYVNFDKAPEDSGETKINDGKTPETAFASFAEMRAYPCKAAVDTCCQRILVSCSGTCKESGAIGGYGNWGDWCIISGLKVDLPKEGFRITDQIIVGGEFVATEFLSQSEYDTLSLSGCYCSNCTFRVPGNYGRVVVDSRVDVKDDPFTQIPEDIRFSCGGGYFFNCTVNINSEHKMSFAGADSLSKVKSYNLSTLCNSFTASAAIDCNISFNQKFGCYKMTGDPEILDRYYGLVEAYWDGGSIQVDNCVRSSINSHCSPIPIEEPLRNYYVFPTSLYVPVAYDSQINGSWTNTLNSSPIYCKPWEDGGAPALEFTSSYEASFYFKAYAGAYSHVEDCSIYIKLPTVKAPEPAGVRTCTDYTVFKVLKANAGGIEGYLCHQIGANGLVQICPDLALMPKDYSIHVAAEPTMLSVLRLDGNIITNAVPGKGAECYIYKGEVKILGQFEREVDVRDIDYSYFFGEVVNTELNIS